MILEQRDVTRLKSRPVTAKSGQDERGGRIAHLQNTPAGIRRTTRGGRGTHTRASSSSPRPETRCPTCLHATLARRDQRPRGRSRPSTHMPLGTCPSGFDVHVRSRCFGASSAMTTTSGTPSDTPLLVVPVRALEPRGGDGESGCRRIGCHVQEVVDRPLKGTSCPFLR
jgi:hypothetical protein